jgi:hypothetical protein
VTGRLSRSSTRYAEVIRPSGYVCWVGSGERPRRARVQILGELTGRGVSTTWCETALKRNKTRKLNPAVVSTGFDSGEGGNDIPSRFCLLVDLASHSELLEVG